jgi:SAM-dependent methyltransferase
MSDPAPTRWNRADRPAADDYDAQWERLAASGIDPHGEVAFLMTLGPSSVLDAGCGTGRVAIELDRRGVDVVGVDLDDGLLAAARAKPGRRRRTCRGTWPTSRRSRSGARSTSWCSRGT